MESTKKGILCLLNRATMLLSLLHTAYFTAGVANSATTRCCWISNKTTAAGPESNKQEVPPKNISVV